MPCWQCDQCRLGRPHTCRKLRFLGCPKQAEGCLSECLVMPEKSCFPIPDAMSFDQAAISEPLAIGVYSVKQSIPMKGAAIGILGAGPIGLSVLLPARRRALAASSSPIKSMPAWPLRSGPAPTGSAIPTRAT